MDVGSRTAAANTAAVLFIFDSNRQGGRVQNPLSAPIYIAKVNPPVPGGACIFVPAAVNGVPGQYVFEASPYEAWWFITTAAGDFQVNTW